MCDGQYVNQYKKRFAVPMAVRICGMLCAILRLPHLIVSKWECSTFLGLVTLTLTFASGPPIGNESIKLNLQWPLIHRCRKDGQTDRQRERNTSFGRDA